MMVKLAHPDEVVATYGQLLQESGLDGHYVEIDGGRRIHVVEKGSGPPLVLLHGTGSAAFDFAPLLERLDGVRALAPDRPGSGLSDPLDIGRKGYREWAVEEMGRTLDALGVGRVTLAGASGGGIWAIWYALANPERVRRLLLLTGIPALPGTKLPLPPRLFATPVIGHLISLMPANEKSVLSLMGMMGEGETIVDYPKLISAIAAANNDQTAAKASRAEYSALTNLLGWKPGMAMTAGELAELSMPTLMIWGTREPLGSAHVARAICETIPDCALELLPAGHGPWLGHPEKVAALVRDFVIS